MNRSATYYLFAITALAASVASAGHRDGGQGDFEHMTEILDLSDSQQQQVAEILAASHQEKQAVHDQTRAERERLQALLDAPAPDPAEVGALVIDLHQRREVTRARHEQARADIEGLLTTEQRQKMEMIHELRSKQRQHRKDLRRGRNEHRERSLKAEPESGGAS